MNNKNNVINDLKILSDRFAPSGIEDSVSCLISENLKDLQEKGYKLYIDNIKNLFCIKKDLDGSSDKTDKKSDKINVIITTHMDEAGFIVTGINKNGDLKFDTTGQFSDKTLLSKTVVSDYNEKITDNKKACGVISAKAVHLLSKEERNKYPTSSDLYIDIGASDKKEASDFVTPGDQFVFEPNFTVLGSNKVSGKALADRMGCLIVEQLLSDIESDIILKDKINLHTVFCAQRHIVSRGLKTALNNTNLQGKNFDLIINIDSIDEEKAAELYKENACMQEKSSDKNSVIDKNMILLGFNKNSVLNPNLSKKISDIKKSIYNKKLENTVLFVEDEKKIENNALSVISNKYPNALILNLYYICKNKKTCFPVINLDSVDESIKSIKTILDIGEVL